MASADASDRSQTMWHFRSESANVKTEVKQEGRNDAVPPGENSAKRETAAVSAAEILSAESGAAATETNPPAETETTPTETVSAAVAEEIKSEPEAGSSQASTRKRRRGAAKDDAAGEAQVDIPLEVVLFEGRSDGELKPDVAALDTDTAVDAIEATPSTSGCSRVKQEQPSDVEDVSLVGGKAAPRKRGRKSKKRSKKSDEESELGEEYEALFPFDSAMLPPIDCDLLNDEEVKPDSAVLTSYAEYFKANGFVQGANELLAGFRELLMRANALTEEAKKSGVLPATGGGIGSGIGGGIGGGISGGISGGGSLKVKIRTPRLPEKELPRLRHGLRKKHKNKKRKKLRSSGGASGVVKRERSDSPDARVEYDPVLKKFTCDKCSFTSKLRWDLIRHERRHSGDKRYKCNVCKYSSVTRSGLRLHVKKRHTPKKCDLCNFVTGGNMELKKHRTAEHHAVRDPFSCTECSYTSKWKAAVIRHVSSLHAQDRPFLCSHCPYATSNKIHLKRHMSKHTGEKPYKCTREGCNYASIRPEGLKVHLLRHDNLKPYLCQYCTHRSADRGNLKKHIQNVHQKNENHTSEKPKPPAIARSVPVAVPPPASAAANFENGTVKQTQIATPILDFEQVAAKQPMSASDYEHNGGGVAFRQMSDFGGDANENQNYISPAPDYRSVGGDAIEKHNNSIPLLDFDQRAISLSMQIS